MGGNFVEQPVTKYFKYRIGSTLENSRNVMKNSFVIGNHSELDKKQREFITLKISNFLDKKTK